MQEDLTHNTDFINIRERFAVPKNLEPKIDEVVSRVVGRKIYLQDPRLIKLIRKWRANKPLNSLEPDNYLEDPEKVKELKQVLSESL